MPSPWPGPRVTWTLSLCAVLCTLAAEPARNDGPTAAPAPLSPCLLAPLPDAQVLLVGCATAPRVLSVDLNDRRVADQIDLPQAVSGLALFADGRRLAVTSPGPVSQIHIVDRGQKKVLRTFAAGHMATAPVLSVDEQTLFVCERFDDAVSSFKVETGRRNWRVRVEREPVAAALTRDGRYLLVANHLHRGRSDMGHVAAGVSVIDLARGAVVKTLRLPNGSGCLNDIRLSPDGRYACVTHLLSRFPLPTTQLERGWMNTNAATFIDLETLEVLNTVLLDSVDRGAANPWGVAWSASGDRVAITHAGSHEVSLIDFPALLEKLEALPETAPTGAPTDYQTVSRQRSDVPNDLAFLVGVRRRVALPEADRGPRAVAIVGEEVYAANYFSDTISVVHLQEPQSGVTSFAVGPKVQMTTARLGEFYFHDAYRCFQQWQSCASCHPGDGRIDALNWDLLNDGLGNPKNNRSLLYSHQMGPTMSLGVRASAEDAVRAGIKHILFTVQPEAVSAAIDEYLKCLEPVPSPYLEHGQLSMAARRGQKVFEDPQVGCAPCHPPGLFSDLRAYDVGTQGAFDRPGDRFYTPALVEIWRTAPYLHDGSAVTLREVVTTRNARDQHGATSRLSDQQIDDLVAYLLSL